MNDFYLNLAVVIIPLFHVLSNDLFFNKNNKKNLEISL